MTIKLNGITISSNNSTVLDYAINTNPNPLQISSTGSISISVSKADPPAVQCTSLIFKVSVGAAAADLTTDSSTISTQCPDEWSITKDGAGDFTFTYQGTSGIGKDGLLFVLNNTAVNDQVGISYLSITENLQSGTNQGSLPLPKFPANFTVSDLTADSYNISPSGTVNLSWDGSAGGNYSLSYNGNTVSNLPNVDNYPVKNLQATTTFTLTVTAEGGTIQLVRQCTVSVEQPVIQAFGLVGSQPEFMVGSAIQLYWTTQNAAYCDLYLNGLKLNDQNLPANVDANQGYSVNIPRIAGEAQYFLYAYGSNGQGSASASAQVSVFEFELLPNTIGNITHLAISALMGTDGTLYVAGWYGLDVISTVTNTLTQYIAWPEYCELSELGTSNPMVMSPDGSQIYVLLTSNANKKIAVVNTLNHQIQYLPLPSSLGGVDLGGVAIGTKDDKSCLVVTDLLEADSTYISSYIYVLDPFNNCSLIQQYKLPNSTVIDAIVAAPQGDRVFLSSSSIQGDDYNTAIFTYNIAANTLSQFEISNFATSNQFIFSSDRSYFYAGGLIKPDSPKELMLAAIAIINSNTGQLIDTITCPPDDATPGSYLTAIGLSPDGLHLYAQVLDDANNYSVFRINLNTLQIVGVLAMPCDVNVNDAYVNKWAFKPDATCLYGLASAIDSNLDAVVYMIKISDGLNAFHTSVT